MSEEGAHLSTTSWDSIHVGRARGAGLSRRLPIPPGSGYCGRAGVWLVTLPRLVVVPRAGRGGDARYHPDVAAFLRDAAALRPHGHFRGQRRSNSIGRTARPLAALRLLLATRVGVRPRCAPRGRSGGRPPIPRTCRELHVVYRPPRRMAVHGHGIPRAEAIRLLEREGPRPHGVAESPRGEVHPQRCVGRSPPPSALAHGVPEHRAGRSDNTPPMGYCFPPPRRHVVLSPTRATHGRRHHHPAVRAAAPSRRHQAERHRHADRPAPPQGARRRLQDAARGCEAVGGEPREARASPPKETA